MSVNGVNVSLKARDGGFALLPGGTVCCCQSVELTGCVGEPCGFLYTEQESQQ